MPAVYLQPAANALSHRNLRISIESPVRRSVLDRLPDFERRKIERDLGDEGFYLWGVKDNNQLLWEKMQVGDIVLFYTGNQTFKYAANVTGTSYSPEFGRAVWGVDEDGGSFSGLYALSEPKLINLGLRALNKAAEYQEGAVPMGFRRLNDQKSSDVLQAFFAEPIRYCDPFDDVAEFEPEFANLQETEREAIRKSRIGQGQFRDGLFDVWGGCSVSMVSNPELLRASHIKPWRDSSNSERLDPYNGLLLLPHYDHLFDRGLISFKESGQILISAKLPVRDCEHLGVNSGIRLIRQPSKTMEYLKFHSSKVFRS
tara:strand:- start:356 stop:1297 length:942 start_codon:yes stop_codon:yes gene_type:complete